MMPKEQYHFIKAIQDHMLEASNMNQHEAWDFGFRVWQFKDYLYWFMTGYGTEKKADTPQTLPKDIVQPCGNGNVMMSEDTYEELLQTEQKERSE